MFCHKCGEQLQSDDTKFCPNCGTSISNSVVKSTPSSNHNDEGDSVKPDRSLSNDVRQKYISKLKSSKESWFGWVAFPVSFVSFMISDILLGSGWWNWVIAIFVLGAVFSLLEAFVGAERKLQNHSDEMLELLYNDMERKKSFNNAIILVIVVGIGILLLALSSKNDNIVKKIWNHMTNDAKCSVVSANVTDDSFLISGEPNYGFSVSTILKNSGKDGNVFVKVSLSSSEGELERKQTVFMDAGTTRSLKFQFVEPTINATNVQYSVSCTPRSEQNDNSE